MVIRSSSKFQSLMAQIYVSQEENKRQNSSWGSCESPESETSHVSYTEISHVMDPETSIHWRKWLRLISLNLCSDIFPPQSNPQITFEQRVIPWLDFGFSFSLEHLKLSLHIWLKKILSLPFPARDRNSQGSALFQRDTVEERQSQCHFPSTTNNSIVERSARALFSGYKWRVTLRLPSSSTVYNYGAN